MNQVYSPVEKRIDEAYSSIQKTVDLEMVNIFWYYVRGLSVDNLEKACKFYLTYPMQHFLLEMGKGFAYVPHQKRLSLDRDHFHADLVFYHIILKCSVVIDLKTKKLTRQDLGQILLYVHYFDEEIKTSVNNPNIGLVLCTDKSNSMVKEVRQNKLHIFVDFRIDLLHFFCASEPHVEQLRWRFDSQKSLNLNQKFLQICVTYFDTLPKYTLGEKAQQIFTSTYQFHLPAKAERETERREELREIEYKAQKHE